MSTPILIQIYEVQTPSDAEKLIALGVDHVGSVVVSKESWKIPEIKDTVKRIHSAGGRSSLIPLFSDLDAICLMLDYYGPDVVHFCEVMPWHNEHGDLFRYINPALPMILRPWIWQGCSSRSAIIF